MSLTLHSIYHSLLLFILYIPSGLNALWYFIMSSLTFDYNQLSLIGDIESFSINKHLILRSKGDSLNSPLNFLNVNIKFSNLHPASTLVKQIDNATFYNSNKELANININFNTLLDLIELFKSNYNTHAIKLLDITSTYINSNIKNCKHFTVILALSKEKPFKIAYNTLCINYNNTLYIAYTDSGNNLHNLIADDIKYTFSKLHKYREQLPYLYTKALSDIYKDPTTVILPNGHIQYKGNNYPKAKCALDTEDFINNYILNHQFSN